MKIAFDCCAGYLVAICARLLLLALIVLIISEATIAFGSTPAAEAAPLVSMEKALALATDYARSKVQLKDYYLAWAFLTLADAGVERELIVSWCPRNSRNPADWFVVAVDKKGVVTIQDYRGQPFGGSAMRFHSSPKLYLLDAMEIAEKHARAKSEFSKYYIDRIGLGVLNGLEDLVWIVSWKPDLTNPPRNDFGFIVVVGMDSRIIDLNSIDRLEWFIIPHVPMPPRPKITLPG